MFSSLFLQFRYATCFDYVCMVVGTISALLAGASLPLMFIIFGDLTESFVGYGKFSACFANYTICNEMYGTNFTSFE